ncbi:hypothetical protein ACIQVR_31745 [Streptomyces xanthochromogenes]|uniref:hypothetical protein n=1 Tax=Streptomyces xanthochromogenes TaxID=67384 RepID=UPI0037FF9076
MLTLDREPSSECIGRELTDQFLGFEHNLPIAPSKGCVPLSVSTRSRSKPSIGSSLWPCGRNPLRKVAEALSMDPALLQRGTGYPDQP